MVTVPATLETLLLIALLGVAGWNWRRPLVVAFALSLVFSRMFLLDQDLPVHYWQVASWVTAVLAVGNVIELRRSLWPGPLLALFLLSLPISESMLPGERFQAQSIAGDDIIREYLENQPAIGAVVMVKRGPAELFAGYGRSRRFGPEPDQDTWFPLASVTKTVTGQMFAQVGDEDLIALATHTAGYPDITEMEGFLWNYLQRPTDPYAVWDEDDLVQGMAGAALAPGRYRYSNAGYCLLGVSLGMAERDLGDLSYTLPDAALRAGAYSAQGVPVPHWSPGVCHGAGGLWARPRDLMLFVVRASIAKRVYHSEAGVNQGLGWKERDGIWYHGGATFGNTAFVAHHLESDTGVVILTSGVAQDIEAFGLRYVKALISPSGPAAGG